MKINNDKRGISLIVLVITIVVMIILASAIILSISSGDIRGKANEAVSSNDISVAREVVAVSMSEWEINYDELKEKGYETFVEYAEEKLAKENVDTAHLVIYESGMVKECIAVCDGIKCGTLEQLRETMISLKNETRSINIVLMQDVVVETAKQQITIYNDNNVTMDLNGKSITGNILLINNNGDLTIKDSSSNKTGKIIATGDASKYNSAYDFNKNGVVDMDDIQNVSYASINGPYTEEYDCNKDGVVDVTDTLQISRNANYVFAIRSGSLTYENAKLTISGISAGNLKGYPTAVQNHYGTVIGTNDYLDCE